MDGTTFIQRFREDTVDVAQPYLWSDPLILRYLDEAQVEFCRATEGIEDSTSTLCTLRTEPGVPLVKVSPKIRKIRGATLSDGRPMEIVSVEEARAAGVGLGARGSGAPRTLIVLGDAQVQVYPVPDQLYTIALDVMRLPLRSITSQGDETEVDDRHIPALMHYALSRAYSRPDADTLDQKRADYFEDRFRAACAEARREQGRHRKPAGATNFSW